MNKTITEQQRSEITSTIDHLWEMYDDAQNVGNTGLADDFASRAFQLLERLPENQVFLSTKH